VPTLPDGLAGHRRALDAFLARAESVHPDDWNRAPARDKWSPAQVAEHLRLTYLVVGGELEGKQGLRIRSPWWLRPLLRFRYLGAILQRGAIPANAGAPRELRPGAGPFDRRLTLDELARCGAEFEAIVPRRPDAAITHHVFGRLAVPDMVRFATVHLDHHARQLGSAR
jgi:hypothetical protein